MQTWWEFGEGSGYEGANPYYRVECAFCGQRGKFTLAHHTEKVQPDGTKKLNYYIATCTNCSNATAVFWTTASGERSMHSMRQLPWPLGQKPQASANWPEIVGRYWIQAKDNLARKNFEMAIIGARSALQCVARDKGAKPGNLKTEIDDLADRVELPRAMKEWAHIVIRDTGNDNAHPEIGQPAATAQEARDVIGYLDFLLEYIYDLPKRIAAFRERSKAGASE